MGIWEFICSTAEAVKRNSPDPAPLKNACVSSYGYASAAIAKIHHTVRNNDLSRLGQWMPDDETKSKIGIYTAKFAENTGQYAMQEGFKLIPGGVAISKIVSKTLDDVKNEDQKSEELKLLEEKTGSLQKHPTGREIINRSRL